MILKKDNVKAPDEVERQRGGIAFGLVLMPDFENKRSSKDVKTVYIYKNTLHFKPDIMVKWPFVVLLVFLSTSSIKGQTEIELKPNQSMHLIGKGPGQDSVINPYADSKSAAIISNMGEHVFEIRIQVKGEIIKTISIAPGKKEEITLEPGYEFYIDGYEKSKSKAFIDFKKL